MRLGYACLNMTLDRKMRGLRLKTLRERGLPYLQTLVDENIALVADILRWNRAHGIDMFRLSSDIVPFGSHAEVDLGLLDFAAARAIPPLAEGSRLSIHPGQFTVISAAGSVWDNSYQELAYHNSLLDILGVDGDIIVHGGGVYGDRAGRRGASWRTSGCCRRRSAAACAWRTTNAPGRCATSCRSVRRPICP